jgi:hypothetical protein
MNKHLEQKQNFNFWLDNPSLGIIQNPYGIVFSTT